MNIKLSKTALFVLFFGGLLLNTAIAEDYDYSQSSYSPSTSTSTVEIFNSNNFQPSSTSPITISQSSPINMSNPGGDMNSNNSGIIMNNALLPAGDSSLNRSLGVSGLDSSTMLSAPYNMPPSMNLSNLPSPQSSSLSNYAQALNGAVNNYNNAVNNYNFVPSNNYNMPTAVNPSNYGSSSQDGEVYNNSGSNYYNSAPLANYNSAVTPSIGYQPDSGPFIANPESVYPNSKPSFDPVYGSNYNPDPGIYIPVDPKFKDYDPDPGINIPLDPKLKDYNPDPGIYNYPNSSLAVNNIPTDTQKAQEMYNDVSKALYDSPLVTQSEQAGLTVEREGGYGVNPRTGSPGAYAQVNIMPYNPVINAAAEALSSGYKEVAINSEGVQVGNPIEAEQDKSISLDSNNPTFTGDNNIYSTYRSNEQLGQDMVTHDYNTALANSSTTYSPVMNNNDVTMQKVPFSQQENVQSNQ